MATASYKSALRLAVSLSQEDQIRLIQELTVKTRNPEKPDEIQHSIMELCGLGKEIWIGIDAQKYVQNERSSWNG